jgi:hypothetical protein
MCVVGRNQEAFQRLVDGLHDRQACMADALDRISAQLASDQQHAAAMQKRLQVCAQVPSHLHSMRRARLSMWLAIEGCGCHSFGTPRERKACSDAIPICSR